MNDYLIQFALLRERAFRETGNRDLYRRLLLCMELSGNHTESRLLYEEILNQHPYCSYAWFNLGWACVQLEAQEDALEAFEYAYITMPCFEEAYRAFGDLAFERGLYRRALQCYTEMTAHAEADSETLVRMAECRIQLGEIDAAKKLCREALQLDPYHAEAFYQLGASYSAEQDYRKAARWFREAIRTEDRREEFHSALASVYNYLGQSQKALGHFWRAVELAPEAANAWLQLAEFLMVAGDMTQALDVLEQALENSTGVELLYCSAACKFLSGRRIEAVSTLQQALEADSSRQASIFRWAPTLRDDAEIRGLLESFR